MPLGPASTPSGKLPPMEVAKAIAFEKMISCMEKHLGKTCWELLGESKRDFTAGQLKTIGGQRPSGRAVQKHWTKVKLDGKLFPGKETSHHCWTPSTEHSSTEEGHRRQSNGAEGGLCSLHNRQNSSMPPKIDHHQRHKSQHE